MDGGDFLDESICFAEKKWWKLVHHFLCPVLLVFFVCHPSDVGETMPVRCTCGRGGCFGLYRDI